MLVNTDNKLAGSLFVSGLPPESAGFPDCEPAPSETVAAPGFVVPESVVVAGFIVSGFSLSFSGVVTPEVVVPEIVVPGVVVSGFSGFLGVIGAAVILYVPPCEVEVIHTPTPATLPPEKDNMPCPAWIPLTDTEKSF